MTPSRLLIILLIFISTSAFPQKNVTDVTKSELTGIGLPEGSKQDKRILMTASAKALLDMKAKEIGRECTGSTEVIFLPAGTNEKQSVVVKNSFVQEGYKISEVQGDIKYSLISRGEKSWIIYLDDTKSGADLYISGLTSLSVNASPQAETKSDPVPQPQVAPTASTTLTEKENFKVPPKETSSTVEGTGFRFTTTNFDDGWTAIETHDYVKISKEKFEVRIYFTVEMTDQMRPPVTEPQYYFWESLVVPSFTITNKWVWEEPLSYFSNYYMYAEAVDKSTGKNCFIGLDISLNTGGATPVLVIAPDRQTYEKQFSHPDNFKKMLGYNRFAISLSDLTGTWVGGDNVAANYYNTITGNYAGMNFVSMSDEFTFSENGDYTSKHSGASGMIGNTTTYNQQYNGKATVTNWEIILPNRWKGATDTFEAWFEAVKGGRVLRLVNKQATGIKYALVKKITE